MMNSGVRVVKERFNPRFSYGGVDLSTPLKEGLRDIPVRVPGQLAQLTNGVRLLAPQYDRLKQPTQDPPSPRQVQHEFKRFVAREAVLDDEFWTAAWLRAESHWEDREGNRYAENLKRKFAEQEFSSMKRRCKAQYGPRCTCIVAVWMDWDNVKHLAPRSVVGTLDLSIRCLLLGETFPGERVRPPFFCRIERTRHNSTYGYIANLCVAKSARREGIATSMMKFTIELAKASGVEQVYAHVHRHNRSARKLYSKLGFKIVEEATDQLEEEKQYLLCLDI